MPAEQDRSGVMPLPDTRPGSEFDPPMFLCVSEELEIKRMDSILPMKRWPTASQACPCGQLCAAAARIVLAGNGAGISGLKIETWGTRR